MRPRINIGQSWGSGTEVPQWGPAPVKGLKDKVLQKLKLFAHNILKNGYRKCVFRYIDIVRNKKITADMEFAGIHHKLHKESLFNLNVNWPHFQKRSI